MVLLAVIRLHEGIQQFKQYHNSQRCDFHRI